MILLKIHFEQNGAMIAVHGIVQNNRPFQVLVESIRYHIVINSPTQVLSPRPCPIAPPTVLVRILIKMPERIHKTRLDKLLHPFPFFRQKT